MLAAAKRCLLPAFDPLAADAAEERHDHAGTTLDGRHARHGGIDCSILGFAHVPQIAAHQPVRVTQAPVEDELAAERRDPPHLAITNRLLIRFWNPSPK